MTSHAAASLEEVARRRPASRRLRPLLGLVPFLRPYRAVIIGAFVALVTATAALLLVPLSVRRMIDTGVSAENLAALEPVPTALFGLAVLLGLATAVRFYLVSWIGERVIADLRSAVFDHIVGLSPAFFEVNHTGEIQSRLTADTTLIKTVLGSTASIALRSTFMLLGAVGMLFVTNPRLTALVLAAIALTGLPLILIGRLVRRHARLSQDRLADTSVFAAEALGAIQTLQAFNHEAEDRRRYREVVETAFVAARRRLRVRAVLTAVVITMILAVVVGVSGLGARAVAGGTVSAGELSQFILYALFCSTSLGALTEVWGEIQLAAGATERLLELLHAEAEIQSPPRPTPLPEPAHGRLELDDVSFEYPTRPGIRALDGLSLRVEPGETVALVGPSGSGKSTVLRLLLRFYDSTSGRVRLDGVDVAHAALDEVRARMAVVPQETAIFTASVAENIRYGRSDASDAEVEAAARAALAHEFIAELPDGYATALGERGMTLSGGQRQRISIARALLRDAPILLLDEATSSLDARSEQLVRSALARLEQGRTTLVIAHRLSTVMRADRIAVLDGGRLVALGTHAELLAQGGLYADLARLQLDADDDSRLEAATA